jgi:hypothetical protein
LLVHASFAFVQAVQDGAALEPPLRSCVEAILECEALVLSAGLPACIVRLGYLYGPHSADLRAYRTAFRLGRPYWSGRQARQYHLHQLDAASALLAAAKSRLRARPITPPTVAPSRSCSSWMRSRAASAGRSRCTFRCTRGHSLD